MSTVEMEHEEPTQDPQEPGEDPTTTGHDVHGVKGTQDVHEVRSAQDVHDEDGVAEDSPDDEPETFDRPYVEKLRKEAADARVKAKDRDALATALWTAHVTATGRLADPTDLVMPDDADPLDVEAVTTAVDDLLGKKPHLASRRPRGDVGAGASPVSETVDLAGILRSRA